MQKKQFGDEDLSTFGMQDAGSDDEATEDRWDDNGILSAFEDGAEHAYDKEREEAWIEDD